MPRLLQDEGQGAPRAWTRTYDEDKHLVDAMNKMQLQHPSLCIDLKVFIFLQRSADTCAQERDGQRLCDESLE